MLPVSHIMKQKELFLLASSLRRLSVTQFCHMSTQNVQIQGEPVSATTVPPLPVQPLDKTLEKYLK